MRDLRMQANAIADTSRDLVRRIARLLAGNDLTPAPCFVAEVDCRTFPSVQSIAQLFVDDGLPDHVFSQDGERWVNTTPQGLTPGVTVFGDGHAAPMLKTPWSRTLMRGLSTYCCRDAVILPSSSSVLTSSGGLVRNGIENAEHFGGIEYVESSISRKADGLYATFASGLGRSPNVVAIAIGGLNSPNYGHFIFDGLQQAFLLHGYLKNKNVVIATAALTAWQRELFSILGIAGSVVELTKPTRFKSVVSTTLTSLHVSYTTRYCRPLYDTLKFIVGTDPTAPRLIYIKRPEGSPRQMLNEAEVIRQLESQGFTVVQPEKYSVTEQIRLFSNADIVVAQTGAALANVGFCPPGCEIVEVMPECYFDQWTRTTSFHLAQNWRVIFCSVPDAARSGHAAGGREHPNAGFSFSLDLDELQKAVDVARASSGR